MIEMRDVVTAFDKASFANTHATERVAEFQSRANGRYIYLDKDALINNRIHLIIDGQLTTERSWLPSNVSVGNRYHSSHMRHFDTHLHTGRNPIHYGTSVNLDNFSSMTDFLVAFNKLSA